jgi:hypothetical protein
MHPHDLHAEYMLERLKTSDAMANLDSKSEIENQISNFKIKSQIQNSNLVLPNGIDLANEVLDLRDLTERYWRIITAQHVRILLLENELLCVRTAKR